VKKLIWFFLVITITGVGLANWYLTRSASIQIQVLLTQNGVDVSEQIDWRVDQIKNPSNNGTGVYSIIKTIAHSDASKSIFQIPPGYYMIEADINGLTRLKREFVIAAGEKRKETFVLNAGLLNATVIPPNARTKNLTLYYEQGDNISLATFKVEDVQPQAFFFKPDTNVIEIRSDTTTERFALNLPVGETQDLRIDLRRGELSAKIDIQPPIAADHVEKYTWALTDQQGQLITLESKQANIMFPKLKNGTYQIEAGIWRESEGQFSQSDQRNVTISTEETNEVELKLMLAAIKVDLKRRPDAPELPDNARRTFSVIETDYKGIPYGFSQPTSWDDGSWVIVSPVKEDINAVFAVYANEFIPYVYNEGIAFKEIGKIKLGNAYAVSLSEGEGYEACQKIYSESKCRAITGGER